MTITVAVPCAAEHRVAIKEKIQAKTATAADFIVYNLLRGKRASTGFCPLKTNPKRLLSGQSLSAGFASATRAGYWATCELSKVITERLDAPLASALHKELVRLACADFDAAEAAGASQQVLRGYLFRAMKLTPYGSASVWGHCRETAAKAKKLVTFATLPAGHPSRPFMAPAWLPEWFGRFMDLAVQGKDRDATRWSYLKNYKCGQPFACLDGSADIWARVGGGEAEQSLMRKGQVLPTLRVEGAAEFAKDPQAPMLLVAAVASLWASCENLGGPEATSFLAKLDELDRLGRALCLMFDAG